MRGRDGGTMEHPQSKIRYLCYGTSIANEINHNTNCGGILNATFHAPNASHILQKLILHNPIHYPLLNY